MPMESGLGRPTGLDCGNSAYPVQHGGAASPLPPQTEIPERLKQRARERQEKIKAKAKFKDEASDGTLSDGLGAHLEGFIETTQTFLFTFSNSKQDIEARLWKLQDEAESGPDNSHASLAESLTHVIAEIEQLKRFTAESSYFLPKYEQRQANITLGELNQQYSEVRARCTPKQKFSFKSRRKKREQAKKDDEQKTSTQDDDRPNNQRNFSEENGGGVNDILSRFASSKPLLTINQTDTKMVHYGPNSVNGADLVIANLVDRTISVCDISTACRINSVQNCKIYIGPVQGSVHIEDVKNCVFALASRQLRIHDAYQCDFYIAVQSVPIIESCSGVRFAPYNYMYEELDEQMKATGLGDVRDNQLWSKVNDFKWLRQQQSPNWSIIARENRLGPISSTIDDQT